jgi:cytochrome c oxidase subunit 4
MNAAHAVHDAHAHATPEARKAKYMKVFYSLAVITVFEVSATFLPLPKLFIDATVILLACIKAGLVGYFFMHLEHETKWLRIVAVLPLFMIMYTAVLVPDTKHDRPTSVYLPLRERIFPKAHEEHHEQAEEDADEVEEEHGAPTTGGHGATAEGTSAGSTGNAPSPHASGTSADTTQGGAAAGEPTPHSDKPAEAAGAGTPTTPAAPVAPAKGAPAAETFD